MDKLLPIEVGQRFRAKQAVRGQIAHWRKTLAKLSPTKQTADAQQWIDLIEWCIDGAQGTTPCTVPHGHSILLNEMEWNSARRDAAKYHRHVVERERIRGRMRNYRPWSGCKMPKGAL